MPAGAPARSGGAETPPESRGHKDHMVRTAVPGQLDNPDIDPGLIDDALLS